MPETVELDSMPAASLVHSLAARLKTQATVAGTLNPKHFEKQCNSLAHHGSLCSTA